MQRKWKRRWQRLAESVLPPVAAGMLLLSAINAPVYANPTGGTVASGGATISTSGNTMTVNQSTHKTIINWQSFGIGSGETVNFVQPGANSVALNRVIGNNPSAIYGTLTANGKVFLVNPNGILFAAGSQVNVGGLVASTLNIADDNFLSGNYVFSGNGGAIVNRGNIAATSEAVFLGPQVANEGVVAAKVVGLGAGSRVSLDFAGDKLLSLTVDTGAAGGSAANSGTITANGGTVIMSAGTADALLGTVVNNTGVIRAQRIDNEGGVIKLLGGTVNVAGTLDASAPRSGDGGFIETSGDKVKIADSAIILTKSAYGKNGKWLIDPTDFTIAAVGGDVTGAFLSNYLNTQGDYEVQSSGGSSGTNGDINVNDAITWNSNNTLTLTAAHDININNAITANGANADLVLNYGHDYNIRTKASYSGAVIGPDGWPAAQTDTSGGVYGSVNFTNSANADGLTINGENYRLIHSMAELAALDDGTTPADTATGKFALARNLDAAGTTYSASGGTYYGVINNLSGTLAGLGHTISNLTINAPTTPNVGLVGKALAGSTIRDLGLVDASVTGRNYLGALLGDGNNTAIKNVYATGSVTSAATAAGLGNFIGGLVGRLQGGSISSSYTDVDVNGWTNVGGLVGGAQINGTVGVVISNSHALGDVTGKSQNVGGLVGILQTGSAAASGSIVHSYAKGAVKNPSGGNYQGGLVGQVGYYNSVSYSFATGNVSAGGTSEQVGGLVGLNYGYLDHVYARGDVSAYKKVGGLVGVNMVNPNNSLGGNIGYAYAAGKVTGLETVGGFAGETGLGTMISDSYATGDVNILAGGKIGGGFIGANHGTIERCYSIGNVTGGITHVGGFAGINQAVGTVNDCEASGSVENNNNSDKMFGENDGTVTNSRWHDAPAEAAAARQEAITATRQAAEQQAPAQQASPQTGADNQPRQPAGNAWQNLLDALDPANLWQPTIDSQRAPGSASIRSVTANGVEYQLEDDAGGNQ